MTSAETAQDLRARNAGRTGLVIVASTRAAVGEYEDRSGVIAVEWLRERGIDTPDALVVADADVPAVIDQLFTGNGSTGVMGAAAGHRPELDAVPDVVLTSGGTGISPSDVTVDAVERVLTRPLPGIAAEFFRVGAAKVPTAVLSRCIAGVVDHPKHAFVMTLPGSRGGVRDGLEVLDGVLEHLLDQLAGGGDHGPSPRKARRQKPRHLRPPMSPSRALPSRTTRCTGVAAATDQPSPTRRTSRSRRAWSSTLGSPRSRWSRCSARQRTSPPPRRWARSAPSRGWCAITTAASSSTP